MSPEAFDLKVLVERAANNLLNGALADQRILTESAENYSDSGEGFDGWLPLSLNTTRKFDFSTSELALIRDACTTATVVSEVAKNVIKHYTSFIIGSGLELTITEAGAGDDLINRAASAKEAAPIRKMK